MGFGSGKFSRGDNTVFSKLVDIYTNATSAMEIQLRALPGESGFSGEAATLTLGPEGGLLMCRWVWHEQKHREGEHQEGSVWLEYRE